MTSDDVIAILRRNESDLRARGVERAALFGSIARGTAGPKSDIDIMIDVDPAANLGLFSYVGLKLHIAGLLDREDVDVIDRMTMDPDVRAPAEADAVCAF